MAHAFKLIKVVRSRLPDPLYDLLVDRLGLFGKVSDCERRGAAHEWYNHDGTHSACYHCRIVRAGRLWANANTAP